MGAIIHPAVSQQKFEAVRNIVVALNERDVDGYIACCTDDVELVPATAAIAGTYSGASGIQRFFADLQDTAPDMQVEIERLEVVGGNVLAFERGNASGRASGVGGDLEFTTLYEFADGRVRRISVFLDRQEATEAARACDEGSG
jgi:ketosteroid isomerase-like protein